MAGKIGTLTVVLDSSNNGTARVKISHLTLSEVAVSLASVVFHISNKTAIPTDKILLLVATALEEITKGDKNGKRTSQPKGE